MSLLAYRELWQLPTYPPEKSIVLWLCEKSDSRDVQQSKIRIT